MRMIQAMQARQAAEGLSAAVLEEHGPLLLAIARGITLDDDEAADVVQATYEIAIRQLHTVRDPSAIRAWLVRIETREALRLARRLRRFVRLDTQEFEPAAQDSDPGEWLDLRAALRRLPRRMRAAVVLHYLGSLSVADTAVALGTSPNTVKSQLRTAIGRLREDLRDA